MYNRFQELPKAGAGLLVALALTVALSAGGREALAQTFVSVPIGVPDLASATADWGDYDSDGDLDLLLTGAISGGSRVALIYRNDNGTFVDINANLLGIYAGAAGWGDYDNDGDLDLIVAGFDDSSDVHTIIYRNDGNDVFTDIEANLVGIVSGDAAWGDYDNDGDLDLLVMGLAVSPTRRTMILYRNDGNDSLVESGAVLQGFTRGTLAWGDYDNDGDLDILVTGLPEPPLLALTAVYRNDGNETFTEIDADLFPLWTGEARWGDYDQDGDLDIFVNGTDGEFSVQHTFVYRNDGGDSFTDIHADIDSAGETSTLSLGDCDNDGDFDVVQTAARFFNTDVYRYDGDSTFTNVTGGLNEGCCGATPLGDYDNDQDLDLLTNLFFAGSNFYRNDVTPPNTPPGVPPNLSETVGATSVTLHWQPASDNQTASAGLTYNIRMGTTPGGGEIVSPMADPATGYRRIVAQGNVFHNTSWPIKNLQPGTYFWSVQAIDNNFSGSPFAPERSFTIAAPPCECPHQADTEPDGFITSLDMSFCIDILFASAEDVQDTNCPSPRFDLDCDGFSTSLDLSIIIDHLFANGPGPCDPCSP